VLDYRHVGGKVEPMDQSSVQLVLRLLGFGLVIFAASFRGQRLFLPLSVLGLSGAFFVAMPLTGAGVFAPLSSAPDTLGPSNAIAQLTSGSALALLLLSTVWAAQIGGRWVSNMIWANASSINLSSDSNHEIETVLMLLTIYVLLSSAALEPFLSLLCLGLTDDPQKSLSISVQRIGQTIALAAAVVAPILLVVSLFYLLLAVADRYSQMIAASRLSTHIRVPLVALILALLVQGMAVSIEANFKSGVATFAIAGAK
jgi:hypothetical protein